MLPMCWCVLTENLFEKYMKKIILFTIICAWITTSISTKATAQESWEWITEPRFSIIGHNYISDTEIPPAQDGIITAWLDEKNPGYIDIATGNWYPLPKIKNLVSYANVGYGLFMVRISDKNKRTANGIIDKKGNWVLTPEFYTIDVVADNLFYVCRVDENYKTIAPDPSIRKYAFIDKTGKIVNDDIIIVSPFHEGLAAAYKKTENTKYGFIDKSCQWVILPQFEKAQLPHDSSLSFMHYRDFVFSDGLCPLMQKNKYGFIDKTGKFVIEPRFEDIGKIINGSDPSQFLPSYQDKSNPFRGDFSGGIAAVKLDGKWGFIDKTGKWVIEPQYTFALPFIDGVAQVKTDRFMYIDATGKIIYRFNSDRFPALSDKAILHSFLGGIGVVKVPSAGDINHFKKTFSSINYYTICINRNGNIVFDDNGYSTEDNIIMIDDGVAKALKNGKWGLIKFK